MFALKPEVKEQGTRCEIWYAIGVASALKRVLFGKSCVVTSMMDGTHNPGSFHPKGLAFDLRIRDLTNDQAHAWLVVLKDELEPLGFDVVFEGGVGATPATTGAHVHVEFDPKPGETFIHRAD